jgi:nitrate/nitrite-specific signal transduction histidine kinase
MYKAGEKEMATKLKQWLEGLDFSLSTRQSEQRRIEIKAPDLNDLAFELATANEISETLPDVLRELQKVMDDLFPKKEQAKLLILFSSPSTSETFLHHSDEMPPSSRFIQELHRTFTLNKAAKSEQIELSVKEKSWSIVPRQLMESNNLTIWLLFSFSDQLPGMEKIKWRTAAIEQTLTKGIKAWYQREQKVKNALQTERSIYAAELHDSLAQVLGYLRIKSAKLDKLCQQDQFEELKPITEDLAAYTHCAYRQTRELITSSRLTMQTENLSQGVVNSIQEFEQQSAIVFELDNRMQLNVLSPKQSMQILYIIRESLSNIVRHSHASHSRVMLNLKNSRFLQVVVEDNGTGIDPEAARRDSFGMQIMQERAERIGAELNITNRSGGGTRTELNLDLGENNE